MLKLARYLKPFIVTIILTITLLFIQALCDLSLPDYMSDIVNVGIQQGGVENAVPKVIRSSELDKIFLFITEEEKSEVVSNYILLDKNTLSSEEYDNYFKLYPILKDEALYKLNTKKKDVIERLNSILAKPEVIVMFIEDRNTSQTDSFIALRSMSNEQINNLVKQIDEKLSGMQDSMIDQSATNYIKNEYAKIGLNINKIQTNYVTIAGAKMVGISLISLTATIIVGLFAAKIAASVGKALRGDVFQKVTSFSNAEFDKFSTASLITRTTNDIQQVSTLIVMGTRMVLYAPILGVGGIIKVINTGTKMTWVIAVAVFAIIVLVIGLFSFAIPKFKQVQKLVDKLNLVTRESLTGMLVIRAFSTQKYEEKKFNAANTNLTNTNLFVNRIMTLMMPSMMFIMNAITLLIVWVGAHRVDAGTMQVGNMMAFIQYTMQIIMAFIMISMISVILPRASVSAQRVSEVLESELSIKDPENPQSFNSSLKGVIEFNNVSFKYPGAEEAVLKNINFKAVPGKTTAFIGSTGSGKSTLINLIPRFYDVTEGEILIDGVNIKKVRQRDLREKIGIVPQKGLLFSGTIESNLKYGGEHISDEDILKASEIAQAIEFITTKAEKFNTEIAQGGTNVSGGQKQRLAIARALSKKPEVFIFDDSFSALDLKTDAALRNALNLEVKDSTMLIVAQRISTIINADQILVLDEGNVVGKGTHEELMKNCEVYKQIALSQLSKEELG